MEQSIIDAFYQVAINIGVDLSSGLFSSWIENFFKRYSPPKRSDFSREFKSFCSVNGQYVNADELLEAWASEGLLTIRDSSLHSENQIRMGAQPGALFIFEDNSVSRTPGSHIGNRSGDNAAAGIVSNNVRIVQKPGYVSIIAGPGTTNIAAKSGK